jgi:hypothetical protein
MPSSLEGQKLSHGGIWALTVAFPNLSVPCSVDIKLRTGIQTLLYAA